MTTSQIVESLNTRFGSSILSVDNSSDMPVIEVDRKAIHPVIESLRDDHGFEFLTDLCGVHYPDRVLNLGVVYHMHNFRSNERIRLKAFVSVQEPEIDTMTDLFPSANWMERETFDFYGILFTGHPNLIRILNVEYLDYFPMRKEYPLEDQTREDKDDRFFGR